MKIPEYETPKDCYKDMFLELIDKYDHTHPLMVMMLKIKKYAEMVAESAVQEALTHV